MSSWDRSRRIPWTHIDQSIDANDVENYREKIYRRIQRERQQLENDKTMTSTTTAIPTTAGSDNDVNTTLVTNDGSLSPSSPSSSSSSSSPPTTTGDLTTTTLPTLTRIRRDYSTWDLVKRTGFGACLGSITGGVFGFMDSMRQAGDSIVLKKASTGAKAKFLFQGTTRSGMLFGSFFGGFHALKYGVEVVANHPGDYTEIAIAGAVSMGALVAKPALRSSLPYAGMLVAMETFNVVMRDSKNW